MTQLPALRRVLEQVFFSCTVSDETIPKKPLWRYLQQDDVRGKPAAAYRESSSKPLPPPRKEALTLALRCACRIR